MREENEASRPGGYGQVSHQGRWPRLDLHLALVGDHKSELLRRCAASRLLRLRCVSCINWAGRASASVRRWRFSVDAPNAGFLVDIFGRQHSRTEADSKEESHAH